MREIRTSGLMSGAGKRGGALRQCSRPASTLPREQIDTIHRDQLEAWGGLHGVRNDSGLESAIAQPQNVYFYGDGDLYEIAAAYAYHLAKAKHISTATSGRQYRQLWTSSKSTASIPAHCRNWRPTKP